jgi:hypothetical protein
MNKEIKKAAQSCTAHTYIHQRSAQVASQRCLIFHADVNSVANFCKIARERLGYILTFLIVLMKGGLQNIQYFIKNKKQYDLNFSKIGLDKREYLIHDCRSANATAP